MFKKVNQSGTRYKEDISDKALSLNIWLKILWLYLGITVGKEFSSAGRRQLSRLLVFGSSDGGR